MKRKDQPHLIAARNTIAQLGRGVRGAAALTAAVHALHSPHPLCPTPCCTLGATSPPPQTPFPPLFALCALHWGDRWGVMVPRPPRGGSGGVCGLSLQAQPSSGAAEQSCSHQPQIFIRQPQISIPEPHTLQGWSRAGFIPSVGSSVVRRGPLCFRGVNNSRSELVH